MVIYECPLFIKCKTVNFLLKVFPCFLCFNPEGVFSTISKFLKMNGTFRTKRERDKRPEILFLVGLTRKKNSFCLPSVELRNDAFGQRNMLIVCFSSYIHTSIPLHILLLPV